ncbi:unnamed protein product [Citrullus colocynthis]|uniref:Uncharacterized protein n=1 Tax=Citrullus colocynthis TaxID=252529 RepID=A0ABP0XT49_9ROSI
MKKLAEGLKSIQNWTNGLCKTSYLLNSLSDGTLTYIIGLTFRIPVWGTLRMKNIVSLNFKGITKTILEIGEC